MEWFKRFSAEVLNHSNHSKHWAIFHWDPNELTEFQTGFDNELSLTMKWSSSQLKNADEYFDLVNAKDQATGAYREPNAVIHDMWASRATALEF